MENYALLPTQAAYTGVGLMSGSSLDGLDMAACTFWTENGQWRWFIDAAETAPYDADWTRRLNSLTAATAEELAKTHVDYGHWLGLTLRRFVMANGLKPQFAASHGHTVFHQPHKHFTLQIGDGETAANYLNFPLVANFRNRDVAMGGQGAPLVPFGEEKLFPACRAFLNLGGIANLSLFQRPEAPFALVSHRPAAHFAYDVCPCNQPLNFLARKENPSLAYDPDGALAASGQVLPLLLEKLNALSYYALVPPKSLGKEWIDAEFISLLSLENQPAPNLLRTVCEHIAATIAADLERYGVQNCELLATGGGVKNRFLMKLIQEKLTPRNITLAPADEKLIDYKEALIFAFLGLMRLLNLPNTLPQATGAKKAVSAGAVHLPNP